MRRLAWRRLVMAMIALPIGSMLRSVADDAPSADKQIAEQTEVLRRHPGDWVALLERGRLYRDSGKFDEAIADFDEVIRVSPDNLTARTGRGKTWQIRGEHDKAIADFTEVIRRDP